MKPLDIYETDRWGHNKIWVIEKITPKGTVTLTQLVWSPDLVNEPGVMRRSTTTTTAKVKNNYLYKKGRGVFEPRQEPIILKTDKIIPIP